MRNIFFLSFMVAALTGCQPGWDKDPTIEGLPPEVEQAPETHMAAMRDAIFILSDDVYEFVEGQEALVEFDVQVLQPDIVNTEVTIPGLQDYLPGAVQSFDPSTGKFRMEWDVPQIFVRGLEAGSSSFDLVIQVNTTSQDGTTAQRPKVVRFRVLRNLVRPEILRLEAEGSEATMRIREGERKTYQVTVLDPNSASDQMTVAAPILMVEGPNSAVSRSGAHLMRVGNPRQDDRNPQLWTYVVTVDTTNRELTTGTDQFYFTLRAYTPLAASNEQLRSLPRAGSFIVTTSAGTVESTAGDVRFWEGMTNHYTFAIYEPKGEARAEIIDMDSKCSGSSSGNSPVCSCTAERDIQLCSITWVPGAVHTDPNKDVEHQFTFRAQAVHKSTGEASASPRTFRFNIRVSPRPPGL